MPDFNINRVLMMVIPVLLALTVHEYAHGLAAWKLGDNTAKNAGRLTLNPLSHLDPLGTLMIFFSGLFGWAKPVPFDPRNFKNPVRDTTLVALAGPLANLVTAVVLALLFRLALHLGLLDLIDLYSKGFIILIIWELAIRINILLCIFNLLPLPPLDGFKVLSYFLPHKYIIMAYEKQIVFLVIFVVLVATGTLGKIIGPIIQGFLAFLIGW
ncbi:site-2 protease family protein [Deltaproteobacteria bacterium OttesenSCG-928-K17]|nr:site-2 protease family protein [Deltaproteobacteria bacterium OttesenSCG-928-K17]